MISARAGNARSRPWRSPRAASRIRRLGTETLQRESGRWPSRVLHRATVWVGRPATDVHLAGVLIENDLVLTVGKGLAPGDCVGISFPLREGEKWLAEHAAYRDPLGLQLKGNWRVETVLARDENRDLALIRLDSPVAYMRPLSLAKTLPNPGEAIHSMNHSGGLEFAWVYAGGTVRQRGKLAIAPGDKAKSVGVLVCQLPAQTGSPGGSVVNDKGELVGIVTAKESAQMVGYAVACNEIDSFLELALFDRPPRTLSGLFARIEALTEQLARSSAVSLALRAEEHRVAGRSQDAYRDSRAAIGLNPGCAKARICLARLQLATKPEAALAELDVAVEKGPFNRDVLFLRAEIAGGAREWRKARGDLERILEAHPSDAAARQRLVGALLELGENDKAATAVADTLRADPKRLRAVAADLLAQADSLEKKFPEVPSVPAGWLIQALGATRRAEVADVLKRALNEKSESDQLAILAHLKGIVEVGGWMSAPSTRSFSVSAAWVPPRARRRDAACTCWLNSSHLCIRGSSHGHTHHPHRIRRAPEYSPLVRRAFEVV